MFLPVVLDAMENKIPTPAAAVFLYIQYRTEISYSV